MLPREGWNFDDPNQSAHPCLSAKNEDSSKTENRSKKEHHCKCLRRFFKRKRGWRKSIKKCLWLIIPSDFKFISFENFTLWETVERKPDFAAVSRTHDMHRLALLLLRLCLTSHQQLRSYGDGATALSLILQTGEAGNRTCDPWFTRQTVYPLHHCWYDKYQNLVC